MKEIGNIAKEDEKSVINLNKVKIIDYNSESFLRDLNKVNEKVKKSREMSQPDHEKKYLSYNV